MSPFKRTEKKLGAAAFPLSVGSGCG